MSSLRELNARERVIVALDCSAEDALSLAKILKGKASWLKVGMTLYYKEGPAFVCTLKELGYKVFLDLKIYDIPFQAAGAVKSLLCSGADMFTLHASGGSEMMNGIACALKESENPDAISLAVTVLTSMDETTLHELNIANTPADQVTSLAKLASESGISGVVASPHEAKDLRVLLGNSAYIVTPGVRPSGASLDDQKRVATPSVAIASGASHIVVGRPITKAESPVAAFEDIVKEIESIKPEEWAW